MYKKILFCLVLFQSTALFFSQVSPEKDYSRAPNSYIFDVHKAYDGLVIPVKKVYSVWSSNQYLQTDDTSTQLPSGSESVSLYWEDVPGLIREVYLDGVGENAKIKVEVNKAKGKGNAVIAYKINDTIYWSWHVWVTDDPTVDAVSYNSGVLPMNIDEVVAIEGNVFMDRNLGAISSTFLGDNWHKSYGLFYQSGRKDPFPSFINKNLTYYEVTGDVGIIRHSYHAQDSYSSNLTVVPTIGGPNENIQKSIKNPLVAIVPKNTSGDNYPWYSVSSSIDGQSHDLWADNTHGNISIVDNIQKRKSVFDPCPNGWRVPSSNTQSTIDEGKESPWGKDGIPAEISLNPLVTNPMLGNIKIYPALGFDFNTSNQKLGIYPLTGKYVFKNNNNIHQSFYHQDINAEAYASNAMKQTDGDSRSFSITSDIARFDQNNGLGKHEINVHGNSGNSGVPVRCVKDLNYTISNNLVQSYDFETEYFTTSIIEETDGLELPNSYIVMTKGDSMKLDRKFPIKKAFAVYNQILTDHEHLDTSGLTAKLLWTTNKNLISKLNLEIAGDIRESKIAVDFNQNEIGNAVIALEQSNGDIVWSWHIWAPNDNPKDANKHREYTTEVERPMSNTIGYTNSGAAPLKTLFMDRNLGALYEMPSDNLNCNYGGDYNCWYNNRNNTAYIDRVKKSGGMHYQWGRKDPLPTFDYVGADLKNSSDNSYYYEVYQPESMNSDGTIATWKTIDKSNYEDVSSGHIINNFAKNVEVDNTLSRDQKTRKVLVETVKKPLKTFTNDFPSKDWLSARNGLENERWGNASAKSVFDPCPQGWRVPDMSFVSIESVKNYPGYVGESNEARGTSPWYLATDDVNIAVEGLIQTGVEVLNSFKGVPQLSDTPARPYAYQSSTLVYPGKMIKRLQDNTHAVVFGWSFKAPSYNIGNYPMAGIKHYPKNENITNHNILKDPNKTGVWTAAPSSYQIGEVNAMIIGFEFMRTSTLSRPNGYYTDKINPQSLMSVRCVKHLDIYRGSNGLSEQPLPVDDDVLSIDDNVVKSIQIYPNPVYDKINISKKGTYQYVLTDMNGRFVKKGLTTNNIIKVNDLLTGGYILKLTDENGKIYVFKVIKK